MIEQHIPLNYNDIFKEVESSRRTIRSSEEYRDLLGFSYRELRGTTILDIGAGDSTFAQELVQKQKRVIRLDPKYSDDLPKCKDDALTGIVQNLPFQDNSFDETISSVALYWVKTGLSEGLLEMIRVTKPDGQIRVYPAEPIEWKGDKRSIHYSQSTSLAYVSQHKAQLPTLFITKISSYKPDDWRNEVSNIMSHIYL